MAFCLFQPVCKSLLLLTREEIEIEHIQADKTSFQLKYPTFRSSYMHHTKLELANAFRQSILEKQMEPAFIWSLEYLASEWFDDWWDVLFECWISKIQPKYVERWRSAIETMYIEWNQWKQTFYLKQHVQYWLKQTQGFRNWFCQCFFQWYMILTSAYCLGSSSSSKKEITDSAKKRVIDGHMTTYLIECSQWLTWFQENPNRFTIGYSLLHEKDPTWVQWMFMRFAYLMSMSEYSASEMEYFFQMLEKMSETWDEQSPPHEPIFLKTKISNGCFCGPRSIAIEPINEREQTHYIWYIWAYLRAYSTNSPLISFLFQQYCTHWTVGKVKKKMPLVLFAITCCFTPIISTQQKKETVTTLEKKMWMLPYRQQSYIHWMIQTHWHGNDEDEEHHYVGEIWNTKRWMSYYEGWIKEYEQLEQYSVQMFRNAKKEERMKKIEEEREEKEKNIWKTFENADVVRAKPTNVLDYFKKHRSQQPSTSTLHFDQQESEKIPAKKIQRHTTRGLETHDKKHKTEHVHERTTEYDLERDTIQDKRDTYHPSDSSKDTGSNIKVIVLPFYPNYQNTGGTANKKKKEDWFDQEDNYDLELQEDEDGDEKIGMMVIRKS
jgi:hypothetical protein